MNNWLMYIGILFLCPIVFVALACIIDHIKDWVINLHKEIVSFKDKGKSEQLATLIIVLTIVGLFLIAVSV